MFAYAPRAFRRPRRPASGRWSRGAVSNAGSPTAPSRTASASLHAASVSSGSGAPFVRIAIAPLGHSVMTKSCPNRAATAFRTVTAAAVTSGPMPSPGRIASRARRPTSDPVTVARFVGGRRLVAEREDRGQLRARRGALHGAPEVEEVVVVDGLLPVRERDHPLLELVELESRGLDPDGGAAVLQRVTPGVLAEDAR